jgi:hypothetical protein
VDFVVQVTHEIKSRRTNCAQNNVKYETSVNSTKNACSGAKLVHRL